MAKSGTGGMVGHPGYYDNLSRFKRQEDWKNAAKRGDHSLALAGHAGAAFRSGQRPGPVHK